MRVRIGERHFDQQASGRLRAGGDAGVVGVRDCPGDGQAKTESLAPACAVGAEPPEGLEELAGAAGQNPVMRGTERVDGGAWIGQGNLADDRCRASGVRSSCEALAMKWRRAAKDASRRASSPSKVSPSSLSFRDAAPRVSCRLWAHRRGVVRSVGFAQITAGAAR